MPRTKYPKELKEAALIDYELTKDAKSVAAKHGVTPAHVWQWLAVKRKRPMVEEKNLIKKLQRELKFQQEENRLLREIVKKTAQVMPIN